LSNTENGNGEAEDILGQLKSREDMKLIVAFTKAMYNQNKMLSIIASNTEMLVNIFEKEEGSFNKKMSALKADYKAELVEQHKSSVKTIILSILGGFTLIAGIFAFIVNVIEKSNVSEIVKEVLEGMSK
jgi:hypothetical protein